jgi:hypothetical protein
VTTWIYIVGVRWYREIGWLWVCYCAAYWVYRECTVCNWTVLTVITQQLLLHFQLHTSTAHLLYKYCTNCTVCNWTLPTVITQTPPLHVQLHNRRETAKADIFWSEVQTLVWNYVVTRIQGLVPSDLTVLTASAVSQFDSNKKHMDVTKITDILCKKKVISENFILHCRLVWRF